MQCTNFVFRVHEFTKKQQMLITTKASRDDEKALLSTLQRLNVLSVLTHPDSLQNITTKDLATYAIQDSLICAKERGQYEINEFVEEIDCISFSIYLLPMKQVYHMICHMY